jgi:hypothetical protein
MKRAVRDVTLSGSFSSDDGMSCFEPSGCASNVIVTLTLSNKFLFIVTLTLSNKFLFNQMQIFVCIT